MQGIIVYEQNIKRNGGKMRISLKELCGIDTETLKVHQHHEASKIIIDACIDKKQELADELRVIELDSIENDKKCILNKNHIEYLDEAINARIQDYEDMGLIYRRIA